MDTTTMHLLRVRQDLADARRQVDHLETMYREAEEAYLERFGRNDFPRVVEYPSNTISTVIRVVEDYWEAPKGKRLELFPVTTGQEPKAKPF